MIEETDPANTTTETPPLIRRKRPLWPQEILRLPPALWKRVRWRLVTFPLALLGGLASLAGIYSLMLVLKPNITMEPGSPVSKPFAATFKVTNQGERTLKQLAYTCSIYDPLRRIDPRTNMIMEVPLNPAKDVEPGSSFPIQCTILGRSITQDERINGVHMQIMLLYNPALGKMNTRWFGFYLTQNDGGQYQWVAQGASNSMRKLLAEEGMPAELLPKGP